MPRSVARQGVAGHSLALGTTRWTLRCADPRLLDEISHARLDASPRGAALASAGLPGHDNEHRRIAADWKIAIKPSSCAVLPPIKVVLNGRHAIP